jgi:hypothetical protein
VADAPDPAGRPPLPPLRTDGLPTLATGEPVLARWFVIAMLLLVPVALVVTGLAWQATDRTPPGPADRLPVGDAAVTIARGDAAFPASDEREEGPTCAAGAVLEGDSSARATARRALGATCQLLRTEAFPAAAAGLEEWLAGGATVRVATFERSGVDASLREEDGRLVLELNARYLFEDATRAAPVVLAQFALVADPAWPGAPVSAQAMLVALGEQLDACGRLSLPSGVPRACTDAATLLAGDDPLADLLAVGFRDARAG